MTLLSEVTSDALIKAMLIGDSKAGKTSALVSLVEAGYHLGILDMDCKIPLSYFHQTIREKCPERMEQVSFIQCRDKYMTNAAGTFPVSPATAYMKACNYATKWEDGSKPAEWGPKHVFVVDTLNLLSIAAFNQAQTIAPDTRDPRQWYKAAQNAVEHFLEGLWGDRFNTNVLVLSHITDIAMDVEWVKDNKTGIVGPRPREGTETKGFPTTIGQALSRHIAKVTNELWCVERKPGSTQNVINTRATPRMDLGTGALHLPTGLPLDTGLATIFAHLKEGK